MTVKTILRRLRGSRMKARMADLQKGKGQVGSLWQVHFVLSSTGLYSLLEYSYTFAFCAFLFQDFSML